MKQTKSGATSQLRDFNADPRMVLLSGLGLILGGAGAVLAWILLRLIYGCTNLFYFQRLSWQFESPSQNHLGWLAVFVPIVGGLIVGVMARYGSEKIRGHGIPEALESILVNGAKISPRVALFKPLGSAVAIGTGGPFGAEGPIIMTAGSVGSLFAQYFHLSDAERSTLLVAGAAAGMAGVFSTPLAATLLAVELLLFEWRPRSFVPVAVAAATAGVLRHFFIRQDPLFAMPLSTHQIAPLVLLGALLVGIAGGALALVLSRAVYASEDFFENHLPIHWMWWPAIGGVVVGLGGVIFPRALATGYDVIDSLLAGDHTWQLIAGILIIKSIIWSFSLGSGTSGGILAPLLMIGGALGALFRARAARNVEWRVGIGRDDRGSLRIDRLPSHRSSPEPGTHAQLWIVASGVYGFGGGACFHGSFPKAFDSHGANQPARVPSKPRIQRRSIGDHHGCGSSAAARGCAARGADRGGRAKVAGWRAHKERSPRSAALSIGGC